MIQGFQNFLFPAPCHKGQHGAVLFTACDTDLFLQRGNLRHFPKHRLEPVQAQAHFVQLLLQHQPALVQQRQGIAEVFHFPQVVGSQHHRHSAVCHLVRQHLFRQVPYHRVKPVEKLI